MHLRREPPPEYHLRCFVLARTVKQFHAHARFEPAAPPLDEAGFRQRLLALVARNPRTVSAAAGSLSPGRSRRRRVAARARALAAARGVG